MEDKGLISEKIDKVEKKEKPIKTPKHEAFLNAYIKGDNVESIKRYCFHCLKALPIIFLVLGFFLSEFYYKIWFFTFVFFYGFVMLAPLMMLLTKEGLLNKYSGGFIMGTMFLALCLVGTKTFFIPPTQDEKGSGVASKLFESLQGKGGSILEKLKEVKETRGE